MMGTAVSRILGDTVLFVLCRLKREEERIAREMAEKEEEEARAVLEQAARSGKIKLPTADGKLDKEAILSQACIFCSHVQHHLAFRQTISYVWLQLFETADCACIPGRGETHVVDC